VSMVVFPLTFEQLIRFVPLFTVGHQNLLSNINIYMHFMSLAGNAHVMHSIFLFTERIL
jgi:hypothetical protein